MQLTEIILPLTLIWKLFYCRTFSIYVLTCGLYFRCSYLNMTSNEAAAICHITGRWQMELIMQLWAIPSLPINPPPLRLVLTVQTRNRYSQKKRLQLWNLDEIFNLKRARNVHVWTPAPFPTNANEQLPAIGIKNNQPVREVFLSPKREGFPQALSQIYMCLMVALRPILVTHLWTAVLRAGNKNFTSFQKRKFPFHCDMSY